MDSSRQLNDPPVDARKCVRHGTVITPIFLAVVMVLCLLPAFWPADVPFINDEPKLISLALDANAHHHLAGMGLFGTHGVHYGPLPGWVYQGLLMITGGHLLALVSLRALLFMLVTAAALVDIAKSTGWWKWFVPMVLAGPYMWLYGRIVWDNTFCIPLGAVLLAAHWRLLNKPAFGAAALWAAAIIALILTHFMVLPLVIPVIAHALLIRPRVLRRYAPIMLLVLLVGIFLPWEYWKSLYVHFRESHSLGGQEHGLQGWWFPLLSGQLLAGTGLERFVGLGWARHINLAVPIIIAFSSVMYALVWLGIIRAIASIKMATPLLCLASFCLQIIFDGLLHVYGWAHPHYYCGTWIITVALAWLGADLLSRHHTGRAMVIAAGSGLAVITCIMAVFLHIHAGSRTMGYGPNLGQRLAIAGQMNSQTQADVSVDTTVQSIKRFPHGLRLLRQMDQTAATGQSDVAAFRVSYRDEDPFDAHLKLEVVPVTTKK